jgi:hypothetical protein
MVQELLVRSERERDWSHHSFFGLGHAHYTAPRTRSLGAPGILPAPKELYLRGTRDCSTL